MCILCDWEKKKAFNHATNGEWPHTNNAIYIYKKSVKKFECIGVGNI